MQAYVAVLAAGVVLASVSYTEACSCLPAHPQQHYCNSDFGKYTSSVANWIFIMRFAEVFSLDDFGEINSEADVQGK